MFTLRPHLDQDFEALVGIRNRINPEPITANQMRDFAASNRANSNTYEIWVAEADDRILAYGILAQGDDLPPGWWYMRVQTDPDQNGQGAATALYNHLESIAREGGAVEIESQVRGDDDAAFAWAEHRGFRSDRLRTESVLDLTTFDGSRFAGAVEKTAATGLRFEMHYPGLPQSDEFLLRMYDLHAETFPEVPAFVPPFPPFETWVKEWRGEGRVNQPVFAIFACDGDRIVGESSLSLPELADAAAYTIYTAVRKAYRGRGLALALKLLTIEAAKARGVTRMRTNNDPDNPAMLAVNAKLGYVLVPGPRRIMKSLK